MSLCVKGASQIARDDKSLVPDQRAYKEGTVFCPPGWKGPQPVGDGFSCEKRYVFPQSEPGHFHQKETLWEICGANGYRLDRYEVKTGTTPSVNAPIYKFEFYKVICKP